MSEVFAELPNWKFEVEEVSANVYVITGRDDRGQRVSRKGTDVEKLLEECKSEAIEIKRVGCW